jgi:CBS domain-containing protein
MKASSTMTRDVVCLTPGDRIDDAHKIMVEWEIRHLPVLDGRRVVGILSDRDVLLHASPSPTGLIVPDLAVADVMTPAPLTCRSEASIASIAALMLAHKIDCTPIIDEQGGLIGLVTSSDLLEILVATGSYAAARPIPIRFAIHTCARPGAGGVFRPPVTRGTSKSTKL